MKMPLSKTRRARLGNPKHIHGAWRYSSIEIAAVLGISTRRLEARIENNKDSLETLDPAGALICDDSTPTPPNCRRHQPRNFSLTAAQIEKVLSRMRMKRAAQVLDRVRAKCTAAANPDCTRRRDKVEPLEVSLDDANASDDDLDALGTDETNESLDAKIALLNEELAHLRSSLTKGLATFNESMAFVRASLDALGSSVDSHDTEESPSGRIVSIDGVACVSSYYVVNVMAEMHLPEMRGKMRAVSNRLAEFCEDKGSKVAKLPYEMDAGQRLYFCKSACEEWLNTGGRAYLDKLSGTASP